MTTREFHSGAAYDRRRTPPISPLPRFSNTAPDARQIPLPVGPGLEHTSAEITIVPDGTIFTARCCCGARHESMIEARHYTESTRGASADDAMQEILDSLGTAAPEHTIARWLLGHADCATRRRPIVCPPPLLHLVNATWDTAAAAIAGGGQVPNYLHALLSVQEISSVVLDDVREAARAYGLPASPAGERLAHAMIRQVARDAGKQPLGAVVIAETVLVRDEGSARRALPDRLDALMLWAVAPTCGFARIAPIQRTVGSARTLGEAVTVPLGVPCPPLDGLLAAAIDVPVISPRARHDR